MNNRCCLTLEQEQQLHEEGSIAAIFLVLLLCLNFGGDLPVILNEQGSTASLLYIRFDKGSHHGEGVLSGRPRGMAHFQPQHDAYRA